MKTSNSFVKWFGPALLALVALQPACLFGRPGPSAVGQGQEYQSGDPTFDQFFANLHEVQVEMASAPKQEKEHRIALAKTLGLELEEEAPPPAAAPPAATPAATPAAPAAAVPGQPTMADALGQSAVSSVPLLGQLNQVKNQVTTAKAQVDQMGAMASNLQGSVAPQQPAAAAAAPPAAKPEPRAPSASLLGRTVKTQAEKLSVQLALSIDSAKLEQNEVKTELVSAPQPLEGDARKLAEAVHDTARSELQLYVRMQKAKRSLEQLQALSLALDSAVDVTFRKGGASKKSEVRKNLEDARVLIKLMQERAVDVSSKAKEVVSKLEESASAKIEPVTEPVAEETEATAKQEEPATAPKQTKSEPAAPKDKSEASKSKPRSASAPRRSAPQVADFEP
jgi:hypothetical protein